VLDGDLLEMPKNIVQKVFDGKTDRVVVISIMGPQSSGKSTLLNFLFGCDFGTSEGRCTKGVYGTYFKFSNIKLPNCDGVFLMDTEGLFATVSAKDAIRRKGFDAKLVLFCLAVSDFVIINTKGNLDDGSAKIIKSSFDRFAALAEENIEWP
jgi:predicted GTPase